MLGASLHARSPVFQRSTAGVAAVPSITHLVIEGDSITSIVPSGPNGSFAYQYGDSRPDRVIKVRAQASRTIGTTSNLNDGANSLMGHVAEDMGYGPQLLTAKIGANDLPSSTAAAYKANLTAYAAALHSANPALKFAWSPPLPYNPTGTPHPQYGNFTAQRATIMADARDPAVWASYGADHYLPLGEHPDFADPALAAALFGDAVHPNDAGQALLFGVYKAAMDSILDAGRATSTQMYDAAWLTRETNLAASATITRRFIVAGLKHTGLALTGGNALAVSGGGGVQVRRAGGAWGASVAGWLYNGDVVDVRLTTSAAASTDTAVNLQVGSETRSLTFRTVAAVTPASVVDGGFDSVTAVGSGATTSFVGKPFDTGLGVVAISTAGVFSTAVTVGGKAFALLRRDGYMELGPGR